MKTTELESKRPLRIDGKNKHNPNSVFVSGPRGFCIEVDKEAFVEGLCKEFGLQRLPIK